MTPEDRTREGWEPRIGDGLTLADVVDHAFDYRGDVTLVTTDGSARVGYVFNRDRQAAEPFLQFFPREGGEPETIPYAKLQTIKFTGKDTAAGNSYAAWLRLREAARSSSRGA